MPPSRRHDKVWFMGVGMTCTRASSQNSAARSMLAPVRCVTVVKHALHCRSLGTAVRTTACPRSRLCSPCMNASTPSSQGHTQSYVIFTQTSGRSMCAGQECSKTWRWVAHPVGLGLAKNQMTPAPPNRIVRGVFPQHGLVFVHARVPRMHACCPGPFDHGTGHEHAACQSHCLRALDSCPQTSTSCMHAHRISAPTNPLVAHTL
jgi:hypothetical protein